MTIPRFSNINYVWSHLLVDELVRLGVDYFCIAPGSRSSPLTVTAARHNKVRTFVHFDERGLAYHALGYVAATRKPCALICTSGTAAANFLPAVIEASKKKLPLIVLTADRPVELRQTGAVQTIDQVGIYGGYTVYKFDLPCPDEKITPRFVLTTVDQAVHRATSGRPPGPVHLNCQFREPLAPSSKLRSFDGYLKNLKDWFASAEPLTQYSVAQPSGIRDIQSLADVINSAQSGIIAVGKIAAHETQKVLDLAGQLNWPVLPDISSGLRLGQKDKRVIAYFDQLLLSAPLRKKWNVDCVLHLGGRMTSKRFYDFIEEKAPKHYVTVLNHPLRNDPLHCVTQRVDSSVGNFCESVKHYLNTKPSPAAFELARLNGKVEKEIVNYVRREKRLSEASVSRALSQMVPEGSGLFLASSMPIRDMDMYAAHDCARVVVNGNRGASGIDGLIASACGFARGLNTPATLLIGDLAFLYDLNSLSMLQSLSKPLVIVVLNNNGGGIFHFLPIAHEKDVFEKFYGTPHDLDFSNAAKLFDLNYAKATNLLGFRSAYSKAVKGKRPTVIEVTIDRSYNHSAHLGLQNRLIKTIDRSI